MNSNEVNDLGSLQTNTVDNLQEQEQPEEKAEGQAFEEVEDLAAFDNEEPDKTSNEEILEEASE